MLEPKTTTAIIEDTLNRKIDIPRHLSETLRRELEKDIQAFIGRKRENLDPLLKFTRKIEGILPNFIMNLLIQKSKKDEDASNLREERLLEIKSEHDKKLRNQLNDKKLLIEILTELLEAEEMPYLEQQELSDIRTVYNNIHLWSINADESLDFIYFRIANSSKIVPAFITASVSQVTLTPYICAMVSKYLSLKEVGNLAKSFKPAFLGEASMYIDAETVAGISSFIPLRVLNNVTQYLILHKHYVHLGEITDMLELHIAKEIARAIKDDMVIAKVMCYMQNQSTRMQLLQIYSNERQERIQNLYNNYHASSNKDAIL